MTDFQRTRSSGEVPDDYTYTVNGMKRDWPGDESWVATSFTKTATPSYTIKTMSDVVCPGYKARSAKGEIINNDMRIEEWFYEPPQPAPYSRHFVYSNSEGNYGRKYDSMYALSEGDLGGWYGEDESAIADIVEGLIAAAVTQAHGNMNSMQLSIPMVLAEGNKTVQSLVSITYRAYKIFKAVKHLDLKFLRRQISRKELEDRYMELRYALRPLVIDANNLTGALAEQATIGMKMRRTARAKQVHTYKNSDIVTVNGFSDSYCKSARSIEINTVVRAGVLGDVTTSQCSVWGADSILETVWEVIPFSFILDWFVNVGDTIAAWSPNIGVQELASWYTIEQNTRWETKLVSCVSTKVGFDVENTLSSTCKMARSHRKKFRYKNPSLAYYPKFNIRLNKLKLLDLGIILKKML